jgi:Tfp pilus assembly protein PilP
MTTLLLALMVAVQASAAAPAQPAPAPAAPAPASQPAPSTPSAAPPAPAPSPSQQPPPPDNYTYSADGRRDPFMSLLGTGPERGAPMKKGEGVAGMALAEISVRGVVQSRGTLIAMIQGPDNRTYLVRQGDRLADGTVQSVTAEGLVVMQDVNDPLSLVKQRIVRKPLRSLEDVKQ